MIIILRGNSQNNPGAVSEIGCGCHFIFVSGMGVGNKHICDIVSRYLID
jgi:hypothetical protein